MGNVRAAVLAAGRGIRMGSDRPKTLVPVGERDPLLHYLLAGLKSAGIDDLIVATGYRAAEVREFVTAEWGEGNLTFVFNARYSSWGNFHSVRVVLDQSPGFDLLVVNSDVVVHPDVFRRVVEKEGDLVLAVEERRNLDTEDMRVELRGDRVRAIGKNLKVVRSHGEFDGVSLIRTRAARAFLDVATNWEWRSSTTGYYEDAYNAILTQVDARAALVQPGEYAEVDTPEDLAAAEAVINRHAAAWQ